MEQEKLVEWLREEPRKEHISLELGYETLPIGHVEEYLDEMCDLTWDAEITNIVFHQYTNDTVCTVSVRLIVQSPGFGMVRPGIASVSLSQEPVFFAEIAKSKAIKNAARSLGNKFGRSLNDRIKNYAPPEPKGDGHSDIPATDIINAFKKQ